MITSRAGLIFLAGLIAAILAGCGQPATTPPPSDTPVPTETATRSVMPTIAPTPTPAPTHPPSPTPDKTTYQFFRDGQHIIYGQERRVCALGQDGKPVFLVEYTMASGNLQVSPDHERVIFTKGVERDYFDSDFHWNELWSARLDGSDLKKVLSLRSLPEFKSNAEALTDEHTVEFTDMQWIPGTHVMAFTTGILDRLKYVDFAQDRYQHDLYLVDTETGSLQQILPAGSGGAKILPSPDGRFIAMIKRGDFQLDFNALYPTILSPDTISLIGIDGSHWQHDILSYDGVTIPLNNGYIYHDPELIWDPDSTGIQAVLFSENPRATTGAEFVGWFIPVTGDAQLKYRVQGANLSVTQRWDVYPSANGRYVAFDGYYGEHYGIHILDTVTMFDHVYYEEQLTDFVRWEKESSRFYIRIQEPPNYRTSTLVRGTPGGDPIPVEEVWNLEISMPDCSP